MRLAHFLADSFCPKSAVLGCKIQTLVGIDVCLIEVNGLSRVGHHNAATLARLQKGLVNDCIVTSDEDIL